MFKLTVLPKWIFTGTIPSVYDTESGTCIEMTAKVYNAMRELQQKTTLFIEELNKTINEFENGIIEDQNCFKTHIDKIMHDYIAMIDEKIKMQDLVIEEGITYIKNNLSESVNNVINGMKESGELDEVILNSFDCLSSEVETINENIDNLSNNGLSMRNDITSLNNGITSLNNDITSLNNNVESINNDISDIKGLNMVYQYDSSTETLNIVLVKESE